MDEQPTSLFVDKQGNVGIGTPDPGAKLDVVGGDVRCDGDIHTKGVVGAKSFQGDGTSLTLQGGSLQTVLDQKLNKIGGEIAGSLSIGSTLTVGTIAGSVEVQGSLRALNIQSVNPMQHRMYPQDPIVYQDIFVALQQKSAIIQLGNPQYDDKQYTSANPWNLRPIIKFGGNSENDGNGALVTIPPGYDTLWLRVLGDRWNVVHAYFTDSPKEDLGLWAGGWRGANSYSPDGSLGDGTGPAHQWMAIPAGRSGNVALISKPNTDSAFWLSGIAFSRNPWAHATQSAVGYNWQLNGGDAVAWSTNNWGYDVLGYLNPQTNLLLKVPVVPSKRDKLLYIINHNDSGNELVVHSAITVGGNPIERLLSTYDNPFSRHWNSKLYERYLAARIPANMIPAGTRFLDVRIDMKYQNAPFHFREIGTHDLDVPL